jgi:ribonuclease HII
MTLKTFGGRVAGVDEAGRGPLAGPVVSAAVILGDDHGIDGLNDSKKLSARQRELLATQIGATAPYWAIGRASVEEIDELNILQATMLAMQRAIHALGVTPELALIDGNRVPMLGCEARAVIKGDASVAEISAASILAKVERDREMQELERRYPGYGLAKHKGYPTRQHIQALQELGVTPIHRKSYAPVKRFL